MEAKITLIYKSESEAETVANAVSPDNMKVPEDLSIETVASGRKVVTSIRYTGGRLGTLISTIDDLLSCVSVAEKTISAVKASKRE